MRLIENRRGATLAIVALCLTVLIGFAAFAIDIGMLLDSRAEAQRAADAGALAGASALLQYRNEPEPTRQGYATTRAVNIATMNQVRNTAVLPEEVSVEFLESSHRIAVTVTRAGIAPLFAGIFGVTQLQAAAVAHASYFNGFQSKCLKPFAVPDTGSWHYTAESIGNEILMWKKSAFEEFPLIKDLANEHPNVRTAIEDTTCSQRLISVGDTMELQSATAPMAGQVDQGLRTLYGLDPELVYDPSQYGTQYDGFNRADWRSSPRVINIVTWDPTIDVGNTRFVVTGFLTLFLNREEVKKGNDLWQFGILLPHKPAGGPCTAPTCSPTSWGIRLVQ